MRCPDCNKFVAYSFDTEPEHDLTVDGLNISGSVRIVLTCEQCGTELKEFNFDAQGSIPEGGHMCEPEIEVEEIAMTTRQDKRGLVCAYELSGDVVCHCGENRAHFTLTDEVPVSDMEELV